MNEMMKKDLSLILWLYESVSTKLDVVGMISNILT